MFKKACVKHMYIHIIKHDNQDKISDLVYINMYTISEHIIHISFSKCGKIPLGSLQYIILPVYNLYFRVFQLVTKFNLVHSIDISVNVVYEVYGKSIQDKHIDKQFTSYFSEITDL